MIIPKISIVFSAIPSQFITQHHHLFHCPFWEEVLKIRKTEEYASR